MLDAAINNKTALLYPQCNTLQRSASVKNTVDVITITQLAPIVPLLASVNNEDLLIGTLFQTISYDKRTQNL